MHARLLAMSAAVLIGGCSTNGHSPTPLASSGQSLTTLASSGQSPTVLAEFGISPDEITPADFMAVQVFGLPRAGALHIAADTMLVSNALGITPKQVERTGMPADITVGDWRLLQTVAWCLQHGLPADVPEVSVDLHPPVRL